MLKLTKTLGISMAALTIACVMAVFYTPPAAAQTAQKLKCNGCVKSKQLKDGGIKSKDLRGGAVSFEKLSPAVQAQLTGGAGGGLKAWARINSDGTVRSCLGCSMSPADTRRISDGNYEVDFTPVGADVRGESRLVSLDTQTGGSVAWMVGLSDRAGDTSAVFVKIRNNDNAAVNSGFNIILY